MLHHAWNFLSVTAESLNYLINGLFYFAQTNIQMHLLLFQLTAFLVEQVCVVVDEVEVVAWSYGHGAATTLCQTVVSLQMERGKKTKLQHLPPHAPSMHSIQAWAQMGPGTGGSAPPPLTYRAKKNKQHASAVSYFPLNILR